MKNRVHNLPFGYRCENGQMLTEETASAVVNEIFAAYIEGKTLKAIADDLTSRGVTYFEDIKTWNKNMIARILDDRRYLGDETYPMLVSSDKFNLANKAREDRGAKQPELPSQTLTVKKMLVCKKCESGFRRVGKWRSREKWLCLGGCKCTKYLDDKTIFDGIVAVINKVIENPDLLGGGNESAVYKPTQDVSQREKEINRLLDQRIVDFKVIASSIFELASSKFDCCSIGGKNSVTSTLSSEYADMQKQESLDEQLLTRTVEKIFIDEDGNVSLMFLGNIVIDNKEG